MKLDQVVQTIKVVLWSVYENIYQYKQIHSHKKFKGLGELKKISEARDNKRRNTHNRYK
jgi:hypothetical protein